MYQQHFGFYTAPFSLVPSLRFLYASQAFEETMAHLIYGLEGGEDFILITGETGAGKTLALNNLTTHLSATYRVALVNVTQIDYREVLKLLLGELGADVPEGADRADLLLLLKGIVLEATAEGRRVLLIVDEAQNLTEETLEGIRLLCNLGPADEQVIQVILSGQPGLLTRLDSPALVLLRQRIRVHYHLAQLNRHEVGEYIRHRCRVAGCEREIFSEQAIDLIAKHSGGVPRLVNILADRALLAAYVKGAAIVDPSHVEVPDDLPRTSPEQRRAAEIAAAAAEKIHTPVRDVREIDSPEEELSPAGGEPGSRQPPAEPVRPVAQPDGDAADGEAQESASDVAPSPMATPRPSSRRGPLVAGGTIVLAVVALLLTRAHWLPLLRWSEDGKHAAVDTVTVDTVSAASGDTTAVATPTAADTAPGTTATVPKQGRPAEDQASVVAQEPDSMPLTGSDNPFAAAEIPATSDTSSVTVADTTVFAVDVPDTAPTGLYIHTGSFRDLSRARRFTARLRRLDLPTRLMRKKLGGAIWYRVLVGPWDDAAAARHAEAVMREEGIRDEMLMFRIR